MNRRERQPSRAIHALGFEQADPSVRNRDSELALVALAKCRPRLALNLLMALKVDGGIADRKGLERVDDGKARWGWEEGGFRRRRRQGYIVDLQQRRRVQVDCPQAGVGWCNRQMGRAL